MSRRTFFFGTIICTAMLGSCTSNKTTLPEPESGTTVAANNTATAITYTSDVKVIIDAKCTICHSLGGGQSPALSSYSDVNANKSKVEARALVSGTMPPSSSQALTFVEKNILQLWLDQGAQQ
jgi:uncharacterized membrane protein